jgi:hypothetical protein
MRVALIALGPLTALALTGCGGAGPSKAVVQTSVEALAKENPFLFGEDQPIIKEASCSKTGKNTYDCVTSLALSSAPDEAHTVTVKMTKLGGKWTAQIPNILQ